MAASDVLTQWLNAEGRATLDRITGRSPDVVGVLDHDYVLRYVNWTAPGLSRAQAEGHSVFNLLPPEYQPIAREAFDRALHHGQTATFETMYPSDHGVIIWVVRVGPIVHEGEVIGAFTINTDVTEQRRAGVDRDRFFSLSLDMLVVVTAKGHLRRINPAFGDALGYAVSEVVGKPFVDFVHPDDVASARAAFEDVLNGHPVSDFENRYTRRDGSHRVFSWRAKVDPLTGDVYAVARDVTEQRMMEAQLRHAQKMEAVGQLAGGIAHDFNNLMQAVLANVELALTAAALTPTMSEHLHEIAGAGRRAAELTKQLLVFSRLQPLRRVPIDLNELLQSLMKMLRRLLPENIAIELRLGDGLSSVSADRTQLEQVIVNLCVNARDAMEHGGKLTLETDTAVIDAHDCEVHPWARPGRFVRISVTDNGVGMTPEVRERAFEPFFSTKGDHRGTGLGLATVYGIVQQHGGLVHLYSEPGQGTTFKLYLPADDRPSAPRAVVPDPVANVPRGLETILIAEDEELVRRPVIQILQSAGYQVLAAGNGREAVELMSKHAGPVALALLDVVMPELGGPETWEHLRRLRPSLRVLFTSGYADERYRGRLPADAEVIDKPFRTDELLRRIRAKLDA